MTKIESDAMLVLLNVTMEPSNVRKKVREPQNVRKELSHVMLELHNVRMVLGHMCFICYEHMSWFYVIGLSFNKMHFTCNWVDLGCF